MPDLPARDDLSPEAKLARHRALVSMPEQPLTWDLWELPIYDAFHDELLTQKALGAALWAVDTLRHALGKDYLAKVVAAERKRVEKKHVLGWWDDMDPGHPLLSQSLWPMMNRAPWVFSNLLHVAAQFALTSKINRLVRRNLRGNAEAVNWIHTLLQFEMAGLALRAGWSAAFETPLGSGKLSDVHLQGPAQTLLIEATSLRMWQRELDALQKARSLSGYVMFGIHDRAALRGVHVSGAVDTIADQRAAEEWVQAAADAIEAIAEDGQDRDVTGPTAGKIHLSRNGAEGDSFSITEPLVPTNPFNRLHYIINQKAEQWENAPQPGWMRVAEEAGIWSILHAAQGSPEAKVEFLTLQIQQMLEPYPQLAGLIIAPAPMWAGNAPLDQLRAVMRRADGSAAIVRSGLPYHRSRETVIIARNGLRDPALDLLIGWYASEAGWLDWALAELGQRPLQELVPQKP